MLGATPVVIGAARRWGWVDHPKDERWHTRPVALMGGIAIFAAAALAVGMVGGYAAFSWHVWLGIALVFAAGLADDAWSLRPEVKLVIQILSTVLVLYAGLAFWRGGPFWASVPLTFLWVIGITNAFNLIDGMDGLAGGVAAIAASVLGSVAWMTGNVEVALVAGAVGGAAAGFLAFNFNPAKVFMGDCGSMTLGYVLAIMAMAVQGSGGPIAATLAPVVVLAVPIFDTTFVTVTRVLTGRSVSEGGTDHTHHRLAHLGMSERRAVLTLYGVSLFFGLCALLVYRSSAQVFLAVLLLAGVGVVAFGVYLASANEYHASLSNLRVRPPTRTERFGALMQVITGAGISWKAVVGMLADLLLVGASFVLAHYLRFEDHLPAAYSTLLPTAVPAVMGVKVLTFHNFKLYKGIWRHAGTPEILRLVATSTVASLVVAAGLWGVYGAEAFSASVLVIDWMITTGVIAGIRFGFRGLRQSFASMGRQGRHVLIYGTGETSLLALRHFRETPETRRKVVGLLDDDSRREGLRVQGVSVLGTIHDLPALCRQHDVDEVIVPGDALTASQRRALKRLCDDLDVACRHFRVELRSAADEWPSRGTGDGAAEFQAPLEP
jgi:UDP-GlcNAc:undecaprenyl-phosphate GlcNAc-1-phosphate transferase